MGRFETERDKLQQTLYHYFFRDPAHIPETAVCVMEYCMRQLTQNIPDHELSRIARTEPWLNVFDMCTQLHDRMSRLRDNLAPAPARIRPDATPDYECICHTDYNYCECRVRESVGLPSYATASRWKTWIDPFKSPSMPPMPHLSVTPHSSSLYPPPNTATPNSTQRPENLVLWMERPSTQPPPQQGAPTPSSPKPQPTATTPLQPVKVTQKPESPPPPRNSDKPVHVSVKDIPYDAPAWTDLPINDRISLMEYDHRAWKAHASSPPPPPSQQQHQSRQQQQVPYILRMKTREVQRARRMNEISQLQERIQHLSDSPLSPE